MKKIIVSSLFALTVVGGAYAQGTIDWIGSKTGANVLQFSTNSTTYSPFIGGGSAVGGSSGLVNTWSGGQFDYALVYTSMTGYQTPPSAPSTLSGLASWTAAPGFGATNSPTTAGSIVLTSPAANAALPWTTGTTNAFMIVGWSANLGSSYSQVVTDMGSQSYINALGAPAYFGMTGIGYVNPGTANPGTIVFSSSAPVGQNWGLPIDGVGTQLYLVAAVPEPGTMALAALGGASLLLFRRRK